MKAEVLSFSNIGKRENNEDYILVKDNVFIVCDGVGGVNKGEVASEFVATNFYNLISNTEVNEANLNAVVSDIQNKLKTLVTGKDDEIGMGTTLATLLTTNGVFYTCHVGDSRVYHFKPQTREFKRTRDHSLVEELIVSKHITEEEAKTHPKKNVITKALIADPNRENDLATIIKIEDVSEGDIFLICSDGVIEAWEDKHLTELFFNPANSLVDISDELQNQCNAFSKDNNSAILVKVQKEDIENESIESVQDTIPALQKDDERNNLTITKNNKKNPKLIKWVLLLALLIGSAVTFLFVYNQTSTKLKPTKSKEPLKSNDIRDKEIHKDTNIKSDKAENTKRINPNPAPVHKTISTSTEPNSTFEKVHSNNKSEKDKNKSKLSVPKTQVDENIRDPKDKKSTVANHDSNKNNSNNEEPQNNTD
jgi:serine/threonine protein phosphatase PrpC